MAQHPEAWRLRSVLLWRGGGHKGIQFVRWADAINQTFVWEQAVVWDKGCYHPSTRLPCRIDGMVEFTNIADVVRQQSSDKYVEVVDAEGKWSAVVDTSIRSFRGDLVILKLRDGTKLKVTPNHPIECVDGCRRADEIKLGDKVPTLMAKRKDTGKTFLSVVDLLGRDYLVGKLKSRKDVSTCTLAEHLGLRYNKAHWWLSKHQVPLKFPIPENRLIAVRAHFAHSWLPLRIPMDYDFGWMVGFYAAEGDVHHNSIQLTHHAKEAEYVARIHTWCGNYGIQVKTETVSGEKARTRINGKTLATIFHKLVPGIAVNKQLSQTVLQGCPEFLAGVLDGWMDGDGHFRKSCNQFEGVSASSKLIEQMSWLLKMRSQPCAVHHNVSTYVKKNGKLAEHWKLRYSPLGHYNNVFATNDGTIAWVDVVDISHRKYKGKVYDITVDHPKHLFYVGNGALGHNSIGMGWRYRRSYEFVLVAHRKGKARWHSEAHDVENIIRPGDYGIKKIIPSATQHPTEKSWRLAAHFIQLHTKPGDIVLDPFMGSGSTGVAAVLTGRRFIGIELDEHWYRHAVQRIKQAAAYGRDSLPAKGHARTTAEIKQKSLWDLDHKWIRDK
jgi:hypothetical protein